jgi:hypothetical protein
MHVIILAMVKCVMLMILPNVAGMKSPCHGILKVRQENRDHRDRQDHGDRKDHQEVLIFQKYT